MDPYLRYLITRIVHGESCKAEHIKVDNPLFPLHDYNTLLLTQEEIGWNNFMRGYASLEWDQHQQRYLAQTKQTTRNTVTWLSTIILDIQEYVYKRWLHRNECLHRTGNDLAKSLLLARIRGLYRQGQVLPD